MIIRRFKPSDLEPVMQLFQDVVHAIGSKYYTQEQVNAWAPKEGLDKQKWLKTLSENISYVVEVEGSLVGFGDMTHSGYIDRLYVNKQHQGRGVARMIFRTLEEEARKLGLKELTTEASIIAMPIAKRCGFEIVREQKKLCRGVELTNYVMRKEL